MGLRIVLSFLFLCMMLNSVESHHWTRHIVLDGDGIYNLYWNPPEDKRGLNEITFKVELKAKGYFVLGFSSDGGMPRSDIVTGWMKDGEVYFQDRHADEFSLLLKDDQQDYELIDAYENATLTVFEFRRKLDTCDKNDMVIDNSTLRIIYAYSEEDPESDDAFHLQNYGWKSVLLLQCNIKEELDLNFDSLSHWDVTSPEINISSTDALLWCKIIKSPQVSEKNHIVYVKPMLQEGHEQFVYHMVLYDCVGGTPEQYEDLLDSRGYECDHPNTPDQILSCQTIIAAWAIGGEDIVLPEHVGLPIYQTPGRYFMFEINYHNPQLRSGIIDHSGLRLYYTPNLRKFDAGNYVVGASILPRVFIVPGQVEYVVAGHSYPECAKSEVPDGGMKIFAIILHSRFMARSIKVRHFRGNKELIPLAEDKNFDTYYQKYRYFDEEVEILQNDQLTVECTYDSSKKSTATFNSLSTRGEICLVVMLYYPQVSGHSSFSAPSFANINKVLNTNITNEEDVTNELESYDWANIDMNEVQNVMRYSEHETQCYVGEFREEEVKTFMSYPDDLIPYEPQSACDVTE